MKMERTRGAEPRGKEVGMKAIGFSLMLGTFAGQLFGAPAIGMVRASPMTAVIGTPTPITVTASITDPTLTPASVNLIQLNGDGTSTILGAMHDDGLNGDASAGDLVFTAVVTLSSASAAQIQLEVSAAFRGDLLRVKSPAVSVFFQPANAAALSIAALAQNLAAGNTNAAINFVVPSDKFTTAMSSFGQQGLSVLASILQAGVLIKSQSDLRVYQSPYVAPDGTTTTVEFSMIPGSGGQWVVNSW